MSLSGWKKKLSLLQAALVNSTGQNASAVAANAEIIDNGLARLTSAYLEAAEQQNRRLEASQRALEQIGQEYQKLLSELSVPVRELTVALNTIQDFEGLKTWGKSLEDAAQPLRTISSSIVGIEEANRANVRGVEALLARWSQHHELVEKTYGEAVKNLNDWTISQSISAQQTNQQFRDKLNEISGFYQESTATVKSLDLLIENERKLHDELQSTLPSLLTQLHDLTTALQETQRKQAEFASTLQEIGKPIKEVTENTRDQINVILHNIADQTSHQTQLQDQLSAALGKSSQENKEANQELLKGILLFEERLQNVLPTRTLYYVQLGLLVAIGVGIVAVAVLKP